MSKLKPAPPIEVGLFQRPDARGIVRCVTEVYGDSYPRRELYDEAAILRLNEEAVLMSAVARLGTGDIVGHAAIECVPHCDVGELGMMMVAGAYREYSLFTRLWECLVQEALRSELWGLTMDVALEEPTMQRMLAGGRARPCALMLNLWPAHSSAGAAADRRSFVSYFYPLRPCLASYVSVPDRYRRVVLNLLDQFGIAESPPAAAPGVVSATEVVTTVEDSLGWAMMRITAVGRDYARALTAATDDLLANEGVHVLYLDLPLGCSGTREACDRAGCLGFVFCGLVPHALPTGHAIRLQRLTGRPSVHTAGNVVEQVTREIGRLTDSELRGLGLVQWAAEMASVDDAEAMQVARGR